MKPVILAAILAATACTSLGPMPATTGMSAVPANRAGVEAQVAAVPTYFLSAAASTQHATVTQQAALLVEPDRNGFVIGGRVFGEDSDSGTEPMVGYRRRLDDGISVAAVAFGTAMHAGAGIANYRATRGGAELAIDAKVIEIASWLAIHGQASVSATAISASGTYCVNSTGIGTDCDESRPDTNRIVDGSFSGIFPSATATLALDLGRRPTGILHSLRLALMGSVGEMPRLVDGRPQSGRAYSAVGLSLTFALGADR
jgi:hypothetical protein